MSRKSAQKSHPRFPNHWRICFAALAALLCVVGTAQAATQVLGGDTVEGALKIEFGETGMRVYAYLDGTWKPQTFSDNKSSMVHYEQGGTFKYTAGYYSGTAMSCTKNENTSSTVNERIWTGGSVKLTMRTTYVSPSKTESYEFVVENTSGSTLNNVKLFHGQDTYLGYSDAGGGFWNNAQGVVGVQKPSQDDPNRLIYQTLGSASTKPNDYASAGYGTVAGLVAQGALNHTLDTNYYTDNGYAVQWNLGSLSPGQSVTINAAETMAVGASLTATMTGGEIGISVVVTGVLDNAGALTASGGMSVSVNRAGWTASINGSTNFSLSPGASQDVPITITCPAVVSVGQVATVTLTATTPDEEAVAAGTFTAVYYDGVALVKGVTDDGTPSISQGTDFGGRLVGSVVTQQFKVYNGGPSNITLLTNSLVGSPRFTVSGLPETLAVGETQTFAVVYSATDYSTATATLTLVDHRPWSPFVMNLQGYGYVIHPDNGPRAGGNLVTITNGTLGSGADISQVTVGGKNATIVDQGTDWVSFIVPAQASTGWKDVAITSLSGGTKTMRSCYLVNAAGSISKVTPDVGEGNEYVTITGNNLCNGDLSDITNVTFCGIAASDISISGTTQVVARTGAGGDGKGHVIVDSVSRGRTIAYNAFLYGGAEIKVLGIDDDVLVDDAAANTVAGTDFGFVAVGAPGTRTFKLRNAQALPLKVSLVTVTGADEFSVVQWPTQVVQNVTQDVVVAFSPTSLVSRSASLLIYNSTTNSPFVVNLLAQSLDMAPLQGPVAGGTVVTITNFTRSVVGLVTNISLRGVSGAITGQGTNWVRFTTPACVTTGWQDGVITGLADWRPLLGSFHYNAPGTIASVAPTSGVHSGGFSVTITGTNLCDGTVDDVTRVQLAGVDASAVLSASATQIVVTAGAGLGGSGAVVVESGIYGRMAKANAFTYTGGGSYTISTNRGSASGGNAVTLTFEDVGGGVNITNVLCNGQPVTIVSQDGTSVTFLMPGAFWELTTVDITIQSDAHGQRTYTDAYTYRHHAWIGRPDYSSGYWTNMGAGLGPQSDEVEDIKLSPDGVLYASGSFTRSGTNTSVKTLARWVNGQWQYVPSMTGWVNKIMFRGTNLYVAGSYLRPNGLPSRQLARLSGTTWTTHSWSNQTQNPYPGGYALAQGENYIYVSDYQYTTSPYNSSNQPRVFRFDETSGIFTAMPALNTRTTTYYALTFYSNALYAGGSTPQWSSGPRTADTNVQQWTGTAWEDVGPMLTDTNWGGRQVQALTVFQGDLYLGQIIRNYYLTNNNTRVATNALLRYDGTGWKHIPGFLGQPRADGIRALDTDGHRLFVAGDRVEHDPAPASGRFSCIAHWDGSTWGSVGSQSLTVGTWYVSAILATPRGIYAGGKFPSIGTNVNHGGVTRATNIAFFVFAQTNGLSVNAGPYTGGTTLTIYGNNLGNGTTADVYRITVCGVDVASIVSVSSSQIVVTTAAGYPGLGDVTVYTHDYGPITQSNGFTYTGGSGLRLTGVDDFAITNGQPPGASAGTWWSLVPGGGATNVLTLVNSGSEALTISGVATNGAGAAAFTCTWPGTLAAGATETVTVAFDPAAPGVYTAAVVVANNSPTATAPFVLNLHGIAAETSVNNGPGVGGNVITITSGVIGSGSDISSVLIGLNAAEIVSQTATSVTVRLPSGDQPNVPYDIVVTSDSLGSFTLSNAYTYHPAGEIFEYVYDWTFWEQVQSLPAPRYGLGAEVLHGSLYALGGSTATNRFYGDVYRFDGTRWHEAPPFQDARAYFATAVFSNSIYGIAGINSTNSAAGFTLWTSYRYDGTNNHYTGNIGNRYRLIAGATLGDYMYAIGGQWTNNTAYAYNWRSPGYGWTTTSISNLPASRMRGAAATLNDAIYYSGGASGTGGTINTNVYRFDGTSWTQVRGLPRSTAGHAATVLDGKMYCIGGYSGTNRYTNVVAFDGTNWTEMAGLPVPRYDLAAATYDGRIYAIGGRTTDAAQREVYRYPARFNVPGVTPSSGSHTGGTVVVIPGTNLCIGGDVTNVTLCGVAAAEIIDATPTQVIVRTAAALQLGAGDVVVYSTSIGATLRADAFTYVGPYSVLGNNGASIASGAAASAALGTAFPSTGGGAALTNTFALTNHTDSAINITSMSFTGSHASAFSTPESGGFTVDAGAVSNFSVAFNPFAGGSLAASLVIESASSGSYLVNLSGRAWAISSSSGSSEGGVSVTITNGAVMGYGDITAVFVDGIEVAPTAQGETWVTFIMPPHEEGAVDIVVRSTSIGDTGLANAYTYLPPSEIYGDDFVWTEMPGLPIALSNTVAFSMQLGDNLYVAGGHDGTDAVTNVFRFDGVQWHAAPGLPAAREGAAGGLLDGAPCLMGGRIGGVPQTNVYLFYGTHWGEIEGLPAARADLVAASLGPVYAIGGSGSATAHTNVYQFDGTEWTEVAGLPSARAGMGCAVRRDKIHVYGGRAIGGSPTFNQYVFDGASWAADAGMPALRDELGSATLNERAYALGGTDGASAQTTAYRFDGINWSDVALLPAPRQSAGTVYWRGALYVLGGSDGVSPQTNVWRLTDGGVSPISGYPAGGYEVTIRGTNLCNGTIEDVEYVSIGNEDAEIVSVSGTQIVAIAAGGDIGPCDVGVSSLTYGYIGSAKAFTYLRGEIMLIGTNGVEIVEGDPASLDEGTDFGSMQVGQVRTNIFGIQNIGNAPLTLSAIEGLGPGGDSFTVTSFPTNELAIGATGQITVVCATLGGDQPAQLAFHDNVYINPLAPEEGSYTVSVFNVKSYGIGTGLGVSQTSLTFNATYGGATPAAQTFNVSNVGADPLVFSNTIEYAGFGETWLNVAPVGSALAASASQIVTNSVSLAGLNAGTHTATIGVWSATATNSPQAVRVYLVIAPTTQTLTWTNPGTQTYTNETLLDATASSGLAPAYTLISGPGILTIQSYQTYVTYTATGVVAIAAAQPGNMNYAAATPATQTWEVTRAPGIITLTNLTQGYTGGAISPTCLTSPTGLTYSLTYDGNPWAPTNVGSYEVIATITDPWVYGATTGTLEITRGAQAISFPQIAAQHTNATVGLAATGGGSGNPVTFALAGGPGSIAGGTNLAFTGVGDVLVVASQAGNDDYNAAPNVTNTVRVFSVTPDNGPYAGGNAVTITNGYFGNVTNVLVGNGAATPSSLGSSWVSLAMPAATNAGLTDITLQTVEYGDILLADAYTYNPAGVISGSTVTQAFIIGNGTLTNAASSAGYGPIVYYYYSSHYQFLYQSNDFATAGLSGPTRIVALGFDVVSDTQSKPLKSFLVRMKHSAVANMSGGMEGTDLTVCYSNYGYVATAGGFDMLTFDTPFDWNGSSNVIVDTAFDRNADWCNCGQTTYDAIASRGSAYRTDSFDTRYDFTHGSTISVLPRIRILVESGSAAIEPSSGSWTGGYPVAISGENLGNGADITNVTLCGASATIVSQTTERVWIAAGKGLNAGVGDVRVYSTSHGETVGSNLFTYVGPGILVSSPAFGPAVRGSVVTNFVVVTNPGTEALVIAAATNNGTGAAMFDVTALVGLTVDPGTASNVPVVFTSSVIGTFTPTAYTVNNGPNSNYYFGLHGSVFSASTNVGPLAGGNTITITNGYFGTITNVLLGSPGSVPATLVESGLDWFTITLPPATNAGTVDITVQISGHGDTTLANAYTYNPAGELFALMPASGSWTGGYPVVLSGTNLCNGALADVMLVTLMGITAAVQQVNGSTQILVVAGVSSSGAAAGDVVVVSTDYGTSVKSNAFEYFKEAQTITFDPIGAKSYGDPAFDAGATASSGMTVSYAISNPDVATNLGAMIYIAGAGTTEIAASQAGNAFYFAAPNITNVLTVTPKGLTVTNTVASNKVYDATTVAWLGGATLVGTVPGDDVSLANAATGTFAQATTGSAIAVTTHMTLAGTRAPHYTLAQPTGLSADITARELTVTGAVAASKTYDGATAATLSSGGGLDGVQGFDTVTLGNNATGTFATTTAGTNIAVTTYMTIGGSDAPNYALTQPTLAADINKANQTITSFPNPGDQFWTNVLTLAATASSGLDVSFEVVSGPAALTHLTELMFNGYGEVVLAARQAGNQNWNPAPSLTNTFNALAPRCILLGTNGAAIANSNAVETANGTDFGHAVVGLQVLTNVFTITNSGNASLTISGIVSNGSPAFSILSAPSVVPVSSLAQFVVAFSPQGGQQNASLTFTHDGAHSPFVMNLTGFGMGGGIQLATNLLSYSATYAGTNPSAQWVVMSNVGVSVFAYTNVITYSAGANGWLASLPNAGIVAQGAMSVLTNLVHITGVHAGTHYATNWVTAPDATNSPQMYVVQLTVNRAAQGISFGVIGDQVITNRMGLAATASSGLAVSFGVSGPAELAGGTNLSFTGTGVVSVTASQAGNTNWLAASNVVHVFTVYPLRASLSGLFHAHAEAATADMGAVIENVYGANATERGILWSTNAGFAAAGATKVPLFGSFGAGGWTQQVAGLVSGITNYYRAYAMNAAGTSYTVEAWVHLKPEAPVADSATSINPDSFLANWEAARGATNYLLDASEDDEFGTFLPGYENRGVGGALSHTVTGLTAGMLYHYRVRAENQAGVSTNSGVISVLTAPRLTILTWPRAAGQTIPEQGSYIVEFATPTQVVTWANPGYQFAYWEGAGAIMVDDYYARTTTVTLLMNSVLTAYYQQQAGGITWTYTSWKTNFFHSILVGDADVCNVYTNGTRLMGPFWYCVESNTQQRLRFPTGVDPVSGWPYVDVTAQLSAGLGDGILDPGECVQVTNIAFYSRYYVPPSNIVWQLRAVEIPAEDRVDTDGDGIPDEYEGEYPSALDPLNPTDGGRDYDEDSMPNDAEWVSGTDPTDDQSFLAMDAIARPFGVGNLLSWPSVTGRVYGLYWTSNALQGYEVILEGIQATPPANTVTDAVFGVDAQGFYHINVRNP